MHALIYVNHVLFRRQPNAMFTTNPHTSMHADYMMMFESSALLVCFGDAALQLNDKLTHTNTLALCELGATIGLAPALPNLGTRTIVLLCRGL